MTTATGRALAQQYDALKQRSADYRCACGRDLVVAYKDGSYVLRCGACGCDPEVLPRGRNTLLSRLRRGERLDALEAQTAERQLQRRLRRDPEDWRADRLLQQLRSQMGDHR